VPRGLFPHSLFVSIALLSGLTSCGRNEPLDDVAATNPAYLPARSLYRLHCNACHGRDGRGSASLFPPLRGSEWITGNPEIPVRIVLHGVQGEIRVRGNRYLNHMVGLGHRLSDEEIATILTYVRISWGNQASAILPTDVERVRRETQDRKGAWWPEDLVPLGLDGISADSAGTSPAPS
jgi:mono/diheme cytochrome c family protein